MQESPSELWTTINDWMERNKTMTHLWTTVNDQKSKIRLQGVYMYWLSKKTPEMKSTPTIHQLF